MAAPILVVGSANWDEFFQVAELPTDGATIFGSQISASPGGKGLNQAIAAHRAGGNVKFGLSIGDDDAGEKLISFLSGQQLPHDSILSADLPTGRALITIDSGGRNQIVVLPGANLNPQLSKFELGGAPGYLVLQLEIGMESVLNLAQRASAAGCKVVLTPAPVAQFDSRVLEFIDVLVMNKTESQEITGFNTPGEAIRFLDGKVDSVVITMGDQGCIISTSKSAPVKLPAQVVQVFDSTGAGDTFCGYLVAELAGGSDLVSAAETATVAAALSVQLAGAAPSIPTKSEVLRQVESGTI